MPLCAVKNLIKMLWTIPKIDKNVKNLSAREDCTFC